MEEEYVISRIFGFKKDSELENYLTSMVQKGKYMFSNVVFYRKPKWYRKGSAIILFTKAPPVKRVKKPDIDPKPRWWKPEVERSNVVCDLPDGIKAICKKDNNWRNAKSQGLTEGPKKGEEVEIEAYSVSEYKGKLEVFLIFTKYLYTSYRAKEFKIK